MALVLMLKKHEKVVIPLPNGCRVEVGVHEVNGNKVRLFFKAPPEIKIWREKIFREITEENHDG